MNPSTTFKTTKNAVLKKLFFTNLFAFLCISLSAQISLIKSVDKTSVDVGTPFTYTIQIKCPSTSGYCNGVIVTDALPSNVDFLGVSPATGNVQSAVYNSNTHSVIITMNSPLNGTTDEVQIVVSFKNGTFTGDTANNQATSNAGSPSNVVSTTATNGSYPPSFQDLGLIVKQQASQPIVSTAPGGSIGYNYSWWNQSQTLSMNNFVLTDNLPPNFRLTYFSDHFFNNAVTPIQFQIYYTTNYNSSFALWPGGPWNTTTQTYRDVGQIGLSNGEYVTALRWVYLSPIPGGGDYYPYLKGFSGEIVGYMDASTPLGSTVTNCMTATGNWSNGNPIQFQYNWAGATNGACVETNVDIPTTNALFEKKIDNPKSGYLQGDDLSFKIYNGLTAFSALAIDNPIIIDILPPELEFVSASLQEEWGGPFTSYGTPIPSGVPTTIITNYNNTGQTFLKWDFTGVSIPYTAGGSKVYSIKINTKVKIGASSGSYLNKSYFSSDNLTNRCTNFDGGGVNTIYYYNVVDTNDWNNNGSTSDSLCVASRPFNIIFPSGAGLESVKWVKGTCDANYTRYPASGNSVPGGQADYLLKVKNLGNVAMKDIKIIDILPFVGDKGVIDLSSRNSEWRPFLINNVITQPNNPNVTIYYSTASNPCRDELTPGMPTPCDNPNWSTTPPNDITTVQSLKFDFGSLIMQPGDSVVLSWPMRVPIDAPKNGEIAWNSFGYIATRNDNGSVLQASEPIKVGIAVKPEQPVGYGNYVWKDINGNGIQDEPATSGINGVRVDLYKMLGINPNINTDELVSYTLTSSKNGEPGYYQFTNLPSATYYAVFHKPINDCKITIPNIVTPNDSLDSDGIELIIGTDTLAITAPINIPAGEYDYRWDLGLKPNCSLVANAAINNLSCAGASNGSIDLTVSGYTSLPTYLWSNGATTQNISNLSAGTYTATITENQTCSITVTHTVTEPNALNLVCSAIDATYNGANNGVATVNPSGGTGTYTYLWSNNANTQSITTLSPGNYSVTVSDSNGCTNTCNTTVSEPPCTVNVSAFGSQTTCSTSNDASILSLVTGNINTVTYLWSNGQTSSGISNLTIGTYSVTVTESPTCSSTTSYTVTSPSSLDVVCSKINVTYNGGNDGEASAAASGGNPPYAYQWSNGQTTSTITGLTASSYNVVVTDSKGCSAACISSVVEPGCFLTLNITGTNVKCNSGTDGSINVSPSGNNSPVTYDWSDGSNTPSISNLTAGTYTVTVTESPTCFATASYTVTEPSALNPICTKIDASSNGNYDGLANVDVTGGTLPYTYLWSNGATTQSISNLAVGTYSVTINDANNCTTSCSSVVNEPNCTITANAIGTNISCNGNQNGTVSVSVNGNIGAITYSWSNGATTKNISNLPAGTYTVTIAESPTCFATASYTITEPAALTVTCTKSDVTTTGGSDGTASVMIGGGTTPYYYNWSNGEITASIINLTAGTYNITVSDSNNCTSICASTITEPNLIYGSIGDYVWMDNNKDGIQDSNEPPIEGVVLLLYYVNDLVQPIATDTTDQNGRYLFSNLLAGDYIVKADKTSFPPGKNITKIDNGVDDTDSDFDASSGLSPVITLNPNNTGGNPLLKDNLTIDLGLYLSINCPTNNCMPVTVKKIK